MPRSLAPADKRRGVFLHGAGFCSVCTRNGGYFFNSTTGRTRTRFLVSRDGILVLRKKETAHCPVPYRAHLSVFQIFIIPHFRGFFRQGRTVGAYMLIKISFLITVHDFDIISFLFQNDCCADHFSEPAAAVIFCFLIIKLRDKMHEKS
jgi:hypothetical protein